MRKLKVCFGFIDLKTAFKFQFKNLLEAAMKKCRRIVAKYAGISIKKFSPKFRQLVSLEVLFSHKTIQSKSICLMKLMGSRFQSSFHKRICCSSNTPYFFIINNIHFFFEDIKIRMKIKRIEIKLTNYLKTKSWESSKGLTLANLWTNLCLENFL